MWWPIFCRLLWSPDSVIHWVDDWVFPVLLDPTVQVDWWHKTAHRWEWRCVHRDQSLLCSLWLWMTSPAEAGSSCMFYFWHGLTHGLFISVVFICKLSDEPPTCPGWTSPFTLCQQGLALWTGISGVRQWMESGTQRLKGFSEETPPGF